MSHSNNYYISNINPKLREFKLDSKVKIKLWNYPINNGVYNKVNINELKNSILATVASMENAEEALSIVKTKLEKENYSLLSLHN